LRAFPGVARIGDGPWSLGAEVDLPIRLHAIRAIFIAWTEIAFDGVREGARSDAFDSLRTPLAKLDAALPDFYARNIISSDYAVTAWQDGVEAARRAVALVEAIEALEFRTLEFDHGRSYADSLETLSLYGRDGRSNSVRWRAAQREAIAADCTALADRTTKRREVALAPLWPTRASAALETNLTAGLTETNFRELGGYIQTWVRERKDGALVLGKDPAEVAECLIKTASLPASFWDSRPAGDTLYAFDYCLHCYLDNPNWGSETMTKIV
jgi:hypothetical protein